MKKGTTHEGIPRRAEPGLVLGVPLPRRGGFGLVVVARVDLESRKPSRVFLAYGFGPRRKVCPGTEVISRLRADHAVEVFRAIDTSLVKGSWRAIGAIPSFDSARWPMTSFKRWDGRRSAFMQTVLSERNLRAQVGDEVKITDQEAAELPWLDLNGSEALEYELDDAIEAVSRGLPSLSDRADPPPPSRMLLPARRRMKM